MTNYHRRGPRRKTAITAREQFAYDAVQEEFRPRALSLAAGGDDFHDLAPAEVRRRREAAIVRGLVW